MNATRYCLLLSAFELTLWLLDVAEAGFYLAAFFLLAALVLAIEGRP